jgi:hypothetical protein
MKVCKLAIMLLLKNHDNQWPHKNQIVDIDMENKFASIRWETTRNIDFVDLEDLKHFSMENSAPRKQKFKDFLYSPFR